MESAPGVETYLHRIHNATYWKNVLINKARAEVISREEIDNEVGTCALFKGEEQNSKRFHKMLWHFDCLSEIAMVRKSEISCSGSFAHQRKAHSSSHYSGWYLDVTSRWKTIVCCCRGFFAGAAVQWTVSDVRTAWTQSVEHVTWS